MSGELSRGQRQGADWLRDHPRSYLADPPGWGKTRQLLTAMSESGADHSTVICTAPIRDAGVWEHEAAAIGYDLPMRVVSYQQMLKEPILDPGAVAIDEAHYLKNRKVKWGPNIEVTARRADVAYEASGTPMPNANGTELYNQLATILPMPSYWKWVEEWFVISTDAYSQYKVTGRLLGCQLDGCPTGTFESCEHWAAFHAANYGPEVMLRRPEADIDIPPMAGYDTPLLTPMVKEQAKAYRDLKDTLLAELSDGTTIEALSASAKFAKLWQASTGLSSADPGAPDKHSGKLALLEDVLLERTGPVLVGVYFHTTAAAVTRMCDRLGLSWVPFGASTSPAQRKESYRAFRTGSVDVMIGSISVVAEGLTLTAANQVVMVERHWLPDVNLQVAKRVHRRGQTASVMVRQLVTPKSVDSGQWERLKEKSSYIGRAMTRAEVAAMIDGLA